MSEKMFHWADYLVTVTMLLVSLGIGFFFAFFRGGQKTKAEYLLGNREMGMGPVCLSLFVTFQSAIALIGMPADTYNTGTMIYYLYVGLSLAYVIGYFTVVPVMYPLHLTSVFEYLELRFKSTAVRLLGTCIGMLQTILYMAVALFSPALALQAAAGLPLWVSVAIVGTIGTVYTAVGGIKSVVWTDAFQSMVLFIGVATVFVKGLIQVGGFSSMWTIADNGGRVILLDSDLRSRHSLWSCVIGNCAIWMVNIFNQSSVQRISSLKTIKAARIAFLLNIPLLIMYGAVLVLTGLLLYAYVVTIGCDPFHAGFVSNKNQLMPYYVMHVLDDLPGFAGLYMSMLFSGALSTVSSGINALAANTVEDLLARPLRGYRDSTVTIIAKVLVVVYGMAAIGLAYAMKALPGPVTQMATTVFGACGGPLTGMFLLGGAVPYTNKYGALLGGVMGLAVNIWLAVGCAMYGAPTPSLPPGPTHNCFPASNLSSTSPAADAYLTSTGTSLIAANVTEAVLVDTTRPFSVYDISYQWLGLVGMLSTFVSGLLLTFITGKTDRSTVDSRLIFPFCRRIFRMPQPPTRPDDQSNVIAMKHYRQSWENFKKRGLNQEVSTGVEPREKEDHLACLEAKQFQHASFTGTGLMDAKSCENNPLVQPPVTKRD